MIASVIAHLTVNESTFEKALGSIRENYHVEIGELIDGRLLPMTIEANTADELDDFHRRLCTLKEVEFVDVVFVQFDESTMNPAS